ncbi:unnamed protein product [Caenorhabditis angaria]|uniref:Sodium/hydrogen exchanger n=1 Tax=Caenorhabditis angaria TaxID=860376 RepID=A0A9P1J1C8_9PELO|nr:unnamed protein product [Caenorhabditis angaria]
MHNLSDLHWNYVETPLLLTIWIISIAMAKLAFHNSQRLRKLFPESAVLIVLGLIADLFFLYLLPPIVLDAGYSMPNAAFFSNIGTILIYAVIGTVCNIVLIGACIFAMSPFYTFELNYVDVLLFSTLISAVDPVAVLSVFDEIHVNKLLYICVFGESLLNDAVTVVLYHAFHSMVKIGQAQIIYQDFTETMMNFLLVAGGGILIGFVFTGITAFANKYSSDSPIVQPLICLAFPYLSYLVSEFVHVSGILAIVTCGLLMKPYVMGSMTDQADITVKYFQKTLSSICEAIIFVFLGFSIFSKNHRFDFIFSITTVIACILCRFIVVFFLTHYANKKRAKKIAVRDQIIMAFGGLRGAICFGLVLILDPSYIQSKPILISTTLIVISVTVFIQGTLIKPLVRFLDIKTGEHVEKSIVQQIVINSCDDIMCGVEALLGKRGEYYWRGQINDIDRKYVQPSLTKKQTTRGTKLMEKLSKMATEEQRQQLLHEF